MPQHRFYVPPTQIFDDTVCIRGTDVWHLSKVLRLSKGDEVIVFDGAGREYRVVLGKRKPREVLGAIVEQWEQDNESPLRLTLVQGVPQARKMDLIVQKASEIGVNHIVPVQTERSDIQRKQKTLSDEKAAHKLDRWTRIGIEAAKQSRRTAIPTISPLVTFDAWLAQPPTADLRLVLWEQADQTRTLKQALGEQPSAAQSAVVVIGPEGGLTAAEVEHLRARGYQPVSLGTRILRTETAGLVVLGILQYVYGDY